MNKKVILVTGGSRGLGSAFVEKLASDGGNTVYFTYLNSDEKAALMEDRFDNAFAVKCDQRDEAQVKSCIEKIFSEQGRIDVLVNNACPGFTPVELLKSDWACFHEILDTNLKGAYFFINEAGKIMRDQSSGKIINVLTSYVLNIPPEKIPHYITAKYALLGLSRAAAAELVKYGIKVNMLSPGLMATDLSSYLPAKYLQAYESRHPMKRMTAPDDVANVLEFLLSDHTQFLNGVNIPVNGGEVFG